MGCFCLLLLPRRGRRRRLLLSSTGCSLDASSLDARCCADGLNIPYSSTCCLGLFSPFSSVCKAPLARLGTIRGTLWAYSPYSGKSSVRAFSSSVAWKVTQTDASRHHLFCTTLLAMISMSESPREGIERRESSALLLLVLGLAAPCCRKCSRAGRAAGCARCQLRRPRRG